MSLKAIVLSALLLAGAATHLVAQASAASSSEKKEAAPAAAATTASPAPSPPLPCAKENGQQSQSATAFTAAMNKYNEENPPSDKPKPQVCSGGTVRWELTSWKMDVPEVTMRRQEWKIDVPETKLNEQEWWVKEPGFDCSDVKTGQYPEERCEDTWIEIGPVKTKGFPNCTTTWHDIISRVCTPVLRDKRVVLGVPEVRMVTKTISMDLPEITMRTREFSMHLPAFYPDSGCIGEDCSKKCEEEVNKQVAADNQARETTVGPAKAVFVADTRAMFECQIDALTATRDQALQQYDKFIKVAEATLEAMRLQGLDGPAAQQQETLNSQVAGRDAAKKKFDQDIANLQDSEKTALSAMGASPAQ